MHMKANRELDAFVRKTLTDGQRQRLHQLILQREGVFVLMQPEVARELGIRDEQRRQVMRNIQELQRRVEPLVKEAQSGGNPQEIWPKIMKMRREQEGKIEGILNEAQRKQWKKMLGQPFAFD